MAVAVAAAAPRTETEVGNGPVGVDLEGKAFDLGFKVEAIIGAKVRGEDGRPLFDVKWKDNNEITSVSA